MPRIAGVNIPEDKQIRIALTYIYGIGRSLSEKLLTDNKIDLKKEAKDLTSKEINKLRKTIEEKHKVEGELRREEMTNIKRLKDISCWKGIRHEKDLPVRGQRTRTNSRTVRGNVRKTMGSGRNKSSTPK